MDNNIEETEQLQDLSPDEIVNKEKNKAIYDRLDILNALSELIERSKDESIDNTTYMRLRAGLDYLEYELNHLLMFSLKRGLVIDDYSARDIANMTKVEKTDSRDIAVKTGIDKEMEYICNFVDYIIEQKDANLSADDMVKFIQNQFEVNGIIEKFFKRR